MDATLLPNPVVEVRKARFGNALPLALLHELFLSSRLGVRHEPTQF